VIWLGTSRGSLSDWLTQLWVRSTGRSIPPKDLDWLSGPTGPTQGIGPRFFDDDASRAGFEILPVQPPPGLVPDLAASLGLPSVHPSVADFYQNTSAYRMECWAEWSPLFQPFGRLLARLFSRRLEQLNMPLASLDTHRGISSRVIALRSPDGQRHTAWIRQLVASRRTLYVGTYSTCRVPGHHGPCVKVCFPLPNGRAVVILRPEVNPDGSLTLISAGQRFGDPGFYLVVEHPTRAWARYVRTMRERIHVYPAESHSVRTDHTLRVWGRPFLRLHYRLDR
jgi:hypothetical protein